MKNLSIYLIIFALFGVVSTQSQAKIISKSGYNFPNVSGLNATLGVAGIGSMGSSATSRPGTTRVELYPNSKRNRFLFGFKKADKELRFRLYTPKTLKIDKLIFVLAGVGGDHNGSRSNSIAAGLAKEGVYAVVVPSSFSSQFALRGSRDGFVGDFKTDSEDYYSLLKYGYKQIRRKFGVHVKRFGLVGYSLGGLSVAYLGKIDKRRKYFNFESMLMINPVVNLVHGVNVLDGYYKEGGKINWLAKIFTGLRIKSNMTSHQKRRPSVKTFNSFQSKINRYSSTSKKFAIGFSLREPLANIIVVSQSWPVVKKGKTTSSPKNELKLLPHSNSKVPGPDAGYARLNAAKKVSYDSYFRNYVLPLANRFKRKVSYKSLSSRSNLYSLKSYMKRDKRLFMIHNQDDMWLRGGDVSKLNRIFGRRGFIFPRGGHMGNFWYKDNWQTTLDILL